MRGSRLQRLRHGRAVLQPHLFGHRLGDVGRQHLQRPPEQGDEDVVLANINFEVHLLVGGRVALRGAADPAAGLGDLDDQVPTGSEFVEVVSGDVGVEVEVFCRLRRRYAVVAGVGEQEDVAASRITERCGDCRDRGRTRWA